MNQKLIWVSEEIANEFDAATSQQGKDEIVTEYCRKLKLGYRQALAELDDDALMFRAAAAKLRMLLSEAFLDHEKKVNEQYESWLATSEKLRSMMDGVRKSVNATSEDINALNKNMASINPYVLTSLSEALQRLGQLISSGNPQLLEFAKFLLAKRGEECVK